MKTIKNKISIIGYRASGKSTLGKLLSEELSFNFVDTDDIIRKKEATSVTEIFSKKGETYFRQIEQLALSDALENENTVLATGGGIVLNKNNRKALEKKSFVIFLRCAVEETIRRIEEGHDRPRLKEGISIYDEVRNTLEERLPLYMEIANLTVDTNSKSISDVLNEILEKIPR